MYLGNSLLIQAPEAGRSITVSPLSQWLGSITAMRRII